MYASYITAIQDNENFMEESSYFDISTAMNKISENEYRWDVIIDSPINEGQALTDSYMLYVYIENKDVEQNALQDISFSIKITGRADQID